MKNSPVVLLIAAGASVRMLGEFEARTMSETHCLTRALINDYYFAVLLPDWRQIKRQQ